MDCVVKHWSFLEQACGHYTLFQKGLKLFIHQNICIHRLETNFQPGPSIFPHGESLEFET